jgi:hypothetical protein
VLVLWVVLLVGLFTYGVISSRRFRYALPLLVVAIVAMPVVFESPQINTVGPYWQARYWLPLAVGMPLLASAVRPYTRRARLSLVSSPTARMAALGVVGGLLVVAQVASFLAALHYYEGLRPVSWTPPGGTPLVLGMFITGQVLLVGFVVRHVRGYSPSVARRAPELEAATTN